MSSGRLLFLSLSILFSLAIVPPRDGGAFPFGRFKDVRPVGGEVRIPLSDLSGGTARFYRLRDRGKEIAFFAVTDSRGVVKVAFDACDACWREKKGYRQEKGGMKCQNCGQKFPVDRLGPNVTGGCNPGHLPHAVRGGEVVIRVDDIQRGARYF